MINNLNFGNNAFRFSRVVKILFAFLFLVSFSSCSLAQRSKAGNGNVTIENRAVSFFYNLNTSGVFKVVLQPGETESVKVETDENLQELIIVDVKNETLYLSMKKNSNFRNATKMTIYVTFKNLVEVKNSMVGNLSTNGVIKQDKLKYTSSAVGASNLEIEVNELDLNISAVGKTEITGKATNCKFVNSAIGSFDGSELIVENMKLKNSAVGSTSVNAQNLDLKNSAVGKTTNKNKNASKIIDEDN